MISRETFHRWYFEGLTTIEQIKPQVAAALGRVVTNSEIDRMLRKVIPPESDYQTKIMDWIKTEYPESFVRKISAGFYSEGGLPDVLAIINGQYIGIEVKRPFIGVPSKLQEETIAHIRRAGGHAGIACFPYEAKGIIEYEKISKMEEFENA